MDFKNILQSVIATGIVALCTIAWNSHTQFVVLIEKVKSISDSLVSIQANHQEVTKRVDGLDDRVKELERKK